MDYTPKHCIGTIFSVVYNRKRVFWKIKQICSGLVYRFPTYAVIKCTSTGKEFKSTNQYSCSFVDSLTKDFTQSSYIVSVCNTQEKSSRAGIEVTKIKNRINYLEAKLEAYTKELEDLKIKLRAL